MLILSELARSDLKGILQYVSQNDVNAAQRLIRELSNKFDLLEANSALGRSRDEFLINLRSFPHKKYVIFYFPIENGVEIFRVIDARRDIETLFTDYFEGLEE